MVSSWCNLLCLLAGVLHLATPSCAAPAPSASCAFVWNGSIVVGALNDGICRSTVRYGEAARWVDSVKAKSQRGIDATALPPSCPQSYGNPTGGAGAGVAESEDCLTATIYGPPGARKLPIYVWIHGGSFAAGSASAPGLDGSQLAKQGNIIVVVLQYRLGVLGLLPPLASDCAAKDDPNLAVRDIILALNQVKKNLGTSMGSSNKITIGGHSSGGSMIRALWSTPGAKNLFDRMIIQSDPFNYGMAPMRHTGTLQRAVFGNGAFASCNSLTDYQAIPVNVVIAAAENVRNRVQNRFALQAAYGPGYPSPDAVEFEGIPLTMAFRPSYGTKTLPNEPNTALFHNVGALTISPSSVPLLVTTVKDEGGEVASNFPPPSGSLESLLIYLGFGDDRRKALLENPTYALPNGTNDLRSTINSIITDAAWRCVTRSVARQWAAARGSTYIAEFRQGLHYPVNDGKALCSGDGVCHQDDIQPVFKPHDSDFTSMVADNWLSFIKTGRPSSGWSVYASSNGADGAGFKALGGDGNVPACDADFWGGRVKWDWQMYS